MLFNDIFDTMDSPICCIRRVVLARTSRSLKRKLQYMAGSILGASGLVLPPAHAQTGPVVATPAPAASATSAVEQQPGDDIIVTGTRSVNRTARESQSPITVVSGTALQETGVPDLASAITRCCQSNANRSPHDALGSLTLAA